MKQTFVISIFLLLFAGIFYVKSLNSPKDTASEQTFSVSIEDSEISLPTEYQDWDWKTECSRNKGFCGNDDYYPWSLVGCQNAPVPPYKNRHDDSPDGEVKLLSCDTPVHDKGIIIEPLDARARYGPGRTISDDDEQSYSKSWWSPFGKVLFHTEVEVLGCYKDQTIPTWSRSTPLSLSTPVEVKHVNAYVFIRYKEGNQYTYAWVHSVTVSTEPDNYIPVCNNY